MDERSGSIGEARTHKHYSERTLSGDSAVRVSSDAGGFRDGV